MKHIYFNGKVYTGSLPLAEAFAVENGKFIFAGSSKSVLKLAGREMCVPILRAVLYAAVLMTAICIF